MPAKNILSLLDIRPSPRSLDYVKNKKAFQLHHLVTEGRHHKTRHLSSVVKKDIPEGLSQLFSVDKDISRMFECLAGDTSLLEKAAQAVTQAVRDGKIIFVYGCGSTGRLAKQMESALWRPFWKKFKSDTAWVRFKDRLPENIEDRLIGEMTGGDRALISALEGFEDLELVGTLQLADHGFSKGDVLFGITEGGETSSVIGAVRAARRIWGRSSEREIEEASKHVFFLYNNPDKVLLPFARSRTILEDPGITKINLTTGPQAITGSTRMQAATSETFVMGTILEAGIHTALKDILTDKELQRLGFAHPYDISQRLRSFDMLLEAVSASNEQISRLTSLETETYRKGKRTFYFAEKALVTVFVDCAERSPTFHLYPLDSVREKKPKCRFRVWTDAKDHKQAWRMLLGRNFRGLDESFYRPAFQEKIDDPYLKDAALKSLASAGTGQEDLYDFSFSQKNISFCPPEEGDLGVAVCLDEEIDALKDASSAFSRFVRFIAEKKGRLALILIGSYSREHMEAAARYLPLKPGKDVVVSVSLSGPSFDPLGLELRTALKLLLNAHSTAVMAGLGRVTGNTMTDVNPSNLKLIGRATHLLQTHVNDALSLKEGPFAQTGIKTLTDSQANAVLYDALAFTEAEGDETSEISEVELAVIRILESLRYSRNVDWPEILSIALKLGGLEGYLEEIGRL